MPNILAQKNYKGHTFDGSLSQEDLQNATGSAQKQQQKKARHIQENLKNLKQSLALTNKSLRVSRRDLSSEVGSRRGRTELDNIEH